MVMVQTGKVVQGKVVVDGDEPLEEGATVAVISGKDSEPFELSPELEAELLEAIAEADRGELVDVEEVFGDLDEIRRRGRPAR